jgi:hypothetical protein
MKPEIATFRATHNGLGSGQFDTGIESLAQGGLALARQDTPQFGRDTQSPIHLGITATRDVKDQLLRALLQKWTSFGPG